MVRALLSKWNDVLAGQLGFVKLIPAVCTKILISGKEFAVGEAWFELKRVDLWNPFCTNNAVDDYGGLDARYGVVSAPEHGDLRACLPTYLLRCVMDNSLFKGNPRLRQPLGRQL